MLTKSSCPMTLQNTPDVPMCHQTRFFDRQVGRNIPLEVNPNLIDMNPTSSFASGSASTGGRRCNNASRRRTLRNSKTNKYAKRSSRRRNRSRRNRK